MAKCNISGKMWMNGNKVSHSNIKNKKKFCANIQKKRIYNYLTSQYIHIKVSTRVIRTLNKISINKLLRKQVKIK